LHFSSGNDPFLAPILSSHRFLIHNQITMDPAKLAKLQAQAAANRIGEPLSYRSNHPTFAATSLL
jgi:hypothetical protein